VPQRNGGTSLLKRCCKHGPAPGTEVGIPVGSSCPDLTCCLLQSCLGCSTVKGPVLQSPLLDMFPVPAPESLHPSLPPEPPSDCKSSPAHPRPCCCSADEHQLLRCLVRWESAWLHGIWSGSSICAGRAPASTAISLTSTGCLAQEQCKCTEEENIAFVCLAQKLPSLVHLNLLFLLSPAFFLCSSEYVYTLLSLVIIGENEQFFAQVKGIMHKCKEAGFSISLFIQVQFF